MANDTSNNFDVFISYSSQNQLLADAMCHALEQYKIKCWIAPRNVKAGEDWAKEIMNGIKNSKIMVLVFTRDADQSTQVIKELNIADKYKKIIIPFIADDVPMNENFEYYLSSTHWLNAYPNPEESFGALVEVVSNTLGMQNAPTIASEANTNNSKPTNTNAGALIRIHPDMECRIEKFGENLGVAAAGQYFPIRLRKGKHVLKFISTQDERDSLEITHMVEDVEIEDVLEIRMAEVKAKRELREQQERVAKQEREKRLIAEKKAMQEQLAKMKAEKERIAEEKYQQYIKRFKSFDIYFPRGRAIREHMFHDSFIDEIDGIETSINKLYADIEKQINNPQKEDIKYIEEYKALLQRLLIRKSIITERKKKIGKEKIENEKDSIDSISWILAGGFLFVLILIPIGFIALTNDVRILAQESFWGFLYSSVIVSLIYIICASVIGACVMFLPENMLGNILEKTEPIAKPFYELSRSTCVSIAVFPKYINWIVYIVTCFITPILSWNLYCFTIDKIGGVNYMLYQLSYLFQGCLGFLMFFLFVVFMICHVNEIDKNIMKNLPKTTGQALITYAKSITGYFTILLCVFGIWYLIIYLFFG